MPSAELLRVRLNHDSLIPEAQMELRRMNICCKCFLKVLLQILCRPKEGKKTQVQVVMTYMPLAHCYVYSCSIIAQCLLLVPHNTTQLNFFLSNCISSFKVKVNRRKKKLRLKSIAIATCCYNETPQKVHNYHVDMQQS